MRQLTYLGKRRLGWTDVSAPELRGPQEALVRPFAAARCDGDSVFLFRNITRPMQLGVGLHYLDPITYDLLGRRPYAPPFAVGHECVAEVVAVGDEVRTVEVGQKVVVPWAISCGHCAHCGIGLTSKCAVQPTPVAAYGFGEAMGPWGGTVSDSVRVPYADAMLVPVPEGIDPISIASASDNINDGWRTVAPGLKARPHAPVLVVGGAARSIGLYAAGIAVALGAAHVDYVDSDRRRLEIAAALGARPLEIPANARARWFRQNAPRVGGRYPVTVDASANPDGLRYAIRSLAPGGICTSVGYYFQARTGLPLMYMYATGATLHTGVSHARANIPDVLALIQARRFRPELVTTLVADWDDAPAAFLERTTKVVVQRAPLYSGANSNLK